MPPHVKNRSAIVYAEDTIVAEMILVTEEQSDLDEMENEEMDESVHDTPTENKKMVPNLKELYSSALTLKENIRQHQESWYENWSPLAADMTGESVKKPCPLFSLILFLECLDTQMIQMSQNTLT